MEGDEEDPIEWDVDRPIPEDAAIKAAHPTRSGRHDEYQEAMRMVGAKRSKGALVELVSWLLIRVKDADKYVKHLEEGYGIDDPPHTYEKYESEKLAYEKFRGGA